MAAETFTKRFLSGLSAILCAVVMATSAWAAEKDEGVVTIYPDSEQGAAFFGNQHGTLSYQFESTKRFEGKLLWQYAAGARTIERGEEDLLLMPGRKGLYELPIAMPPVREGVSFETRLVVTVIDGDNQEVASHVQPIWLFSEDPFVDRREWLAGLDLHLYDPEDATVARFDEAKIPYTRINNSNVLPDFEGGILIVGSGTSLRKNRGLTDNLMKLAQRGVRVLCIAPVDGEFPWPTRDEFPELAGVQFTSKQVIYDLDKRLFPGFDALPGLPGKRNTVTLESRRGQLRVNLSETPDGWPWWQVRFDNGGTCILCCFDVIQHWTTGPTPRYSLARLLEELSSETGFSPTEQ
ncbi:hypothetical protein [Blastopirellula marina]|uniref:Uncharacterized protein n=1 Tax=Blastopirellula marina TaxID=124 RepID=A0A2S8GQS5_9BACT|nr:hypothetical protein [Blastopirellula marina]PQO46788.1 hypothetical protein C5Y93_06445 [Blastopirellula marina]